MKILDEYFKSKGITGVKFGVVYNIELTYEIKYWNEDGSVTTIEEVPSGLEKGIFCFKTVNGHPTLIKR